MYELRIRSKDNFLKKSVFCMSEDLESLYFWLVKSNYIKQKETDYYILFRLLKKGFSYEESISLAQDSFTKERESRIEIPELTDREIWDLIMALMPEYKISLTDAAGNKILFNEFGEAFSTFEKKNPIVSIVKLFGDNYQATPEIVGI